MKRKVLLITLISIFSITLIGCSTTTNNTNNNNTNTNNTSKYIGDAKAKQIALSDAGLKENEISDLSVEFDNDDDNDKTIYEVGFKNGQQEYDYDIDATTGKILDKNVEIDD